MVTIKMVASSISTNVKPALRNEAGSFLIFRFLARVANERCRSAALVRQETVLLRRRFAAPTGWGDADQRNWPRTAGHRPASGDLQFRRTSCRELVARDQACQ